MVFEANTRTNDQFGYDRYMIVAMAPERIEEQLAAIREAVEQSRFKVVIPAHVTVMPPFYGLDDLDKVKSMIRSISSSTPKPFISFKDSHFSGTPEFGGAGLELSNPEELLAFQRELESNLNSHISGFRYPAEWMYRKHMTYVLGLDEEHLEIGVEMGDKVELGNGFTIETVPLQSHC